MKTTCLEQTFREKSYKELLKEQANILSEFQELKIQNSALQQETDQTGAQYNTYTKILDEHKLFKVQAIELQKTNGTLDEKCRDMLEENKDLKSKLSAQNVISSQLNSDLEKLTSQFQQLKTELSSKQNLQCAYIQLDSEYKKIIDECKVIKIEYLKQQASCKQYETQNKKLLADNTEVNTRYMLRETQLKIFRESI